MCGILGEISLRNKISKKTFLTSLNSIRHRGPDGQGIYSSVDGRIMLGHNRLSFLDLSEKGKQPFPNPSKTLWITFNGEIYNYLELKKELQHLGYTFTSDTDTEVILLGYECWGKDIFTKLNGIFALGILDLTKKELLLVRDRFGVKPLYYTFQNGDFTFSSELKPILHLHPSYNQLDKASFCDFFVYRYIPSPHSIWKNINKLPPATSLVFNLDTQVISIEQYWNEALNNKIINSQEAIEGFDHYFQESIKRQSRSDVEIGAFLSGGYDSSAICAYLKKSGVRTETFSIGFDNWQNSEDQFATIVANHLDLPNNKRIANEKSLALLEQMPTIYDEPLADISIIPTYMVSQLASQKVKAVFGGEGADELLVGYNWQQNARKINSLLAIVSKLSSSRYKQTMVNYYARSMAMGWFDNNTLKSMLTENHHSHIRDDVHWFYKKHFRKNIPTIKSIQWMDIKCFMGELVLTKIDRASMANSLEVRVPFLDNDLVSFVLNLHPKVYLNSQVSKYVLYKNIEGKLPKVILDRKKQGFVGPDSYYMNINWYKNLFKNSNLVQAGIVKRDFIEALLRKNYDWRLWKLAVMEKWFTHWQT